MTDMFGHGIGVHGGACCILRAGWSKVYHPLGCPFQVGFKGNQEESHRLRDPYFAHTRTSNHVVIGHTGISRASSLGLELGCKEQVRASPAYPYHLNLHRQVCSTQMQAHKYELISAGMKLSVILHALRNPGRANEVLPIFRFVQEYMRAINATSWH